MIRRRVRDGGIWRLDSLGAGILDRDPGFRYLKWQLAFT